MTVCVLAGCSYAGSDGASSSSPDPVNMVNWFDAIVFCNKLSIACGLKPVYSYNFGNGERTNPDDWFKDENNLSDSVPTSEFNSNFANWRDEIKINLKANGYRLPTDAEWEFAARGGDLNEKDENEKLIWFYTYSGSDSSSEVAWCPRTGESKTGTNVVGGMQKANRLGIYDMSGNVSEWCNDYYYEISENVNKDDSNYLDQDGYVNNPMIVSSNNARRLRGGNWSSTEGNSGVYFRGEGWAAFGRDKSYGFRLVRSTQ